MNYHILDINLKQDSIRVVFHIPVPDVTNDASYSYRLAVKESLEMREEDGTIKSIVPTIGAELTQLQSGELVEIVVNVTNFSADLTPAQKLAEVETQYTARKADLLSTEQEKLKYWGKKGDVA